jgi:serine protease AprX
MPKQVVLVEVFRSEPAAFERHAAATESVRESESHIESLSSDLPGDGLDMDPRFPPVPMFSGPGEQIHEETAAALSAFGRPAVTGETPVRPGRTRSKDLPSSSYVMRAEVDVRGLRRLKDRRDVKVYPASRLYLLERCECGKSRTPRGGQAHHASTDELDLLGLGHTAGGLDCRPFREGVPVATIREQLGVSVVWNAGFKGQNIVVGIVDEGVDGQTYPVIGGYQGIDAPAPGTAPVTSHGSMCAADVLVAAPWAKLYDYPLIAQATTADGVQMYQQILNQRGRDGTPHITNNSYGFYGIPSQQDAPDHEAWDINHPFHRKVREVVLGGVAVFFAAGNCGRDCPASSCHSSAIGPDCSINASAALAEVMTIAAVNSRNERIGYSSQGPSLNAPGFERRKPDVACYSHFFGNFGPGRPGGAGVPFDNGTSAATPTAAGVAALLLSRFRDLPIAALREALVSSAVEVGPPGWDADTGHGVINAAAAYTRLLEPIV